MERRARTLVPGTARGPALVLNLALSFWGGVDPETGLIIDASHPERGHSVAGRLLVMPAARGSSSSSYVVAEVLRVGKGPAGIVLGEPDPILPVGVIVAHTLYGIVCPIVVAPIDGLQNDRMVSIEAKAGAPARIFSES